MRKVVDNMFSRSLLVLGLLFVVIFTLWMIFGSVGEVTVRAVDKDGFLELTDGQKVALAGVNMGGKGDARYEEAIFLLDQMTRYKMVWLEKNEMGQAWVWFACDRRPWFGFGCKDGVLVNEELVRAKVATPDDSKMGVVDKKYWERISKLEKK